ncbi:phosphate acyltransferase, partial [Pseudarthrobacter sp. AL07]|uniref:phosphate acyltransferase n=1 Tax=unclassified Pseudarthrobacter TaxID=2647000 RepID=UPI00249B3501
SRWSFCPCGGLLWRPPQADGEDQRAIRAATAALAAEGTLSPRLVGRSQKIRGFASQLGCDVPQEWIFVVGELAQDSTVSAMIGNPSSWTRCGRNTSTWHAAALRAGYVDACVAGAGCPTALVLRAALRVIGLAPGCRTLSSSFLMLLPDGRELTFSDCAVVPDPSSEQLADIAAATAATHQALTGEQAKVAMLSFSTRGGAVRPHVDKVKSGMGILRIRPLVPQIGASKAPDSAVAGHANVLNFPTLNAANIGYKITERPGGAVALGPILQGLAAPMNDLSRGRRAEDMFSMGLLSAMQSLAVQPA